MSYSNNIGEYIKDAKRIIIGDRITNPNYIPEKLIGYENEVKTINEKLYDAIINKNSVTCLVNGPRSSGKSMLIKYCLNKYNIEEYKVVKFSAVTHFNDNLAFKEIAKALNINIERGTPIFETIDIIKKSLGVITQEDDLAYPLGSKNVNSSSVIQTNKRKKKNEKNQIFFPVIVIIDELDDILKNNSKQNLLYNILDLAHYKDTSISFFATCSHHEIFDLFEKRIKSRFTQEMILIPRLSFTNVLRILLDLLLLPDCPNESFNQFVKDWNKSVVSVFDSKDVKRIMETNFYNLYTRLPYYHNLLIDILDSIDEKNPFITPLQVLNILKGPDSISILLNRLTVPEFTILACLLQTANSQNEYISFNDLYNGQYKSFSESYYKNENKANKSTVLSIIQKLLELGLIKSQSRFEIGEFIKIKISISNLSIKEFASKSKKLPSSLIKYTSEWLQ